MNDIDTNVPEELTEAETFEAKKKVALSILGDMQSMFLTSMINSSEVENPMEQGMTHYVASMKAHTVGEVYAWLESTRYTGDTGDTDE